MFFHFNASALTHTNENDYNTTLTLFILGRGADGLYYILVVSKLATQEEAIASCAAMGYRLAISRSLVTNSVMQMYSNLLPGGRSCEYETS